MTPTSVAGQVAAMVRKISSASSKDLPPSYSRVDLTTVGLSITDHLCPPPPYHSALQNDNFDPSRAKGVADSRCEI